MLVPCRQGSSVTLQHKHTHTHRVMAGCQNSPEQWLWSFYEPPESWFPLNVALKLESTQYYYHTVNTPTALKRLRLIYMTALGRYVMVIFHWRMLTAINHRYSMIHPLESTNKAVCPLRVAVSQELLGFVTRGRQNVCEKKAVAAQCTNVLSHVKTWTHM